MTALSLDAESNIARLIADSSQSTSSNALFLLFAKSRQPQSKNVQFHHGPGAILHFQTQNLLFFLIHSQYMFEVKTAGKINGLPKFQNHYSLLLVLLLLEFFDVLREFRVLNYSYTGIYAVLTSTKFKFSFCPKGSPVTITSFSPFLTSLLSLAVLIISDSSFS